MRRSITVQFELRLKVRVTLEEYTMKTKIVFSMFPTMFMLLMLTGTGASAADVHFGVGIGGHNHYYHNHDYVTVDPSYSTWYSDNTTPYSYYDNNTYTDSTYVDPYVYSTPGVEFNSWYGGGYRNHGSYYNGGHGYSGGFRGGAGAGHSGGGGHRR
jgi:hypothetical protein